MMSYQDFKGMMRQGQGKRNRGRHNGGGHHQQQQQQGNRPRPPHRVQVFESSGPSVKIRGNAYQVFERYIALAREAASAGDRIAAENLYQHAEHYFRVMNADGNGQGNQMVPPRPMTPADTEMTQPEPEPEASAQPTGAPQQEPEPPPQA
ncbi:MAG TPA: DUF4167 domain-containing protein [Stellaceae bacterium]|jgi:hypothetical protein|nr:DUF4167 domain-containing protein [Stellaceae bacterium]